MIFWKYLLPIHKCIKETGRSEKCLEFSFLKNYFFFFENISDFYFKETLAIHTKITSDS